MIKFIKKLWSFALKPDIKEEEVAAGVDPPSCWRFVDVDGNDVQDRPTEEIVLVDEKKVKQLLAEHLSRDHPKVEATEIITIRSCSAWGYHDLAHTVTWDEVAKILNHIHWDHFKEIALDKPHRVVTIEINHGSVEVKGARNLMTDHFSPLSRSTRFVIDGDWIHFTVGTLGWKDLS